MMKLLKKIYRLLSPKETHYPKGMNSNVDSLSELVEIGKNFISAPGSIILAHDASTITHTGKTRIEKTIVGDDVFLGANAVILAGSNIGNGCIIGAGAIVSKNIPPNSVVVGNPGKVIMSVQEYIEKCEDRNVLYGLPEEILKKHGSGVRYTETEINDMNNQVLKEYNERNQSQI